jgi:hypothetical protein
MGRSLANTIRAIMHSLKLVFKLGGCSPIVAGSRQRNPSSLLSTGCCIAQTTLNPLVQPVESRANQISHILLSRRNSSHGAGIIYELTVTKRLMNRL